MKLLYITRNITALSLLFSLSFSVCTANAQTAAATKDTLTYASTAGKQGTIAGMPAAEPAPAATQPQTDTSWKPVRRLWGLTFGDFYYDAHADASNRGPETNYNGVPTYRNAFQFRRIYLGYDYDINQKFSVEMLLSSEPSANTNVFMLVYCSEVKNPYTKACKTISHAGVPGPIVAKSIMRIPRMIVFENKTRRYPRRRKIAGITILKLMAATACGMRNKPDWMAVNPSPT